MENKSIQLNTGWTVFAIILITGLFYFIYLPVAYDFDGTTFSQFLRHAIINNNLTGVHQPQHPLYMPVNFYLYKALNAIFGYNVLEYFHLQLFSLAFGLLLLWMGYKILKQLTEEHFFIFAGVLLLASSYGIWYYSVEAEVHMPGLFFTAMGIYLLFFKNSDNPTWLNIITSALSFALAAGFHLTNGLGAIAAFLILLFRRYPFKKIMGFCVAYGFFLILELMTFAFMTSINLIHVYKEELAGRDALAGYKISYWDPFSLKSLWESIKASAQGIWFTGNSLPAMIPVMLFLICGLFILYKFKSSPAKKKYGVFGLWMLPYFAFFTFWDHTNTEFKLHVVIPFIFLFILSVSELSVNSKVKSLFIKSIVLIIILTVGAVNFNTVFSPASKIENNKNYLFARDIETHASQGASIVICGCGSDLSIHNKIYLPYFAYRKTLILDWMIGKGLTLDDIRRQILLDVSRGNGVYFLSEALEDGKPLKQLLSNHHIKLNDYMEFIRSISFTESIPLREGEGYYLKKVRL